MALSAADKQRAYRARLRTPSQDYARRMAAAADLDAERTDRAVAYARWRDEAYAVGEVVSPYRRGDLVGWSKPVGVARPKLS